MQPVISLPCGICGCPHHQAYLKWKWMTWSTFTGRFLCICKILCLKQQKS